jgi:hypothetical protein
MEKIMIFGIAIWFGLFLTDAPQAIKKDPQPLPVVRMNDIDKVNPNQLKPVYKVDADKPAMPHAHPIVQNMSVR